MARLSLQGERSSLRELAYNSLRAAIISLQLAPGERITEESLSDDLGVSRPVLRESIQRLQVEGLVERTGNGRVRVRPATVEDLRHLYDVRSALEQLAVEETSTRMTDAGLAELRDALERMRDAESHGDPQRVTDGGGDFHHALARLAANPVNDEMMRLLRGRIDRYRRISVRADARPQRSVREHEAIFAALAEHDVTAAKQAMHQHIMAGREAALEALHRLDPPDSGTRSAALSR